MKQPFVNSPFWRQITGAALGGALALFGMEAWKRRGSPLALAFLLLFVLCLALLVWGIVRAAARDTEREQQREITLVTKLLAERQEGFAFYPIQDNMTVEVSDLCQQIRRICNRLLLTRYRLQSRENRFRFIFANLNEGFVLLDQKRHVLSYNHIAQQILGIPDESENKLVQEVIHSHRIQEGIACVLEDKDFPAFDTHLPDGRIFSIQIRLVKQEEPRRKCSVLILVLDVTADRTALQQRQDFFSNASHEMRTPITSILGFSEMLEQGMISDPEQMAQSVHIIRREASRMSRIINDLLFISKLENEDEPTAAPPINVLEIAQEIKETLTPDMQERNITMEISGGNFQAAIPYSHLHSLLANLMQNAVKYNVENGSVWVRIETDGRLLRIGVRDTGIGIPDEMKTRVFERFFRADKGRSRGVGGTGLGLSMVKHLVTLYHGSVSLDSTLGKGSFFRLTLQLPTPIAPAS